jgi:hypothetical protein
MSTDERVEPTVSEQRAVLNNPAGAVMTIKRQQAEMERLYKALAKANAHHEHFERESYLRGDEIERLQKILRDWGICGWERSPADVSGSNSTTEKK